MCIIPFCCCSMLTGNIKVKTDNYQLKMKMLLNSFKINKGFVHELYHVNSVTDINIYK